MTNYSSRPRVQIRTCGRTGRPVRRSITTATARRPTETAWANSPAEDLVESGFVDIGRSESRLSGNSSLLFDGQRSQRRYTLRRDVLDQPGVRWVIFSGPIQINESRQ